MLAPASTAATLLFPTYLSIYAYLCLRACARACRESPDAYVVNSVGNCFNSLGQWAEAREAYLTSAQLFQQAKVRRGGAGGAGGRPTRSLHACMHGAGTTGEEKEEEQQPYGARTRPARVAMAERSAQRGAPRLSLPACIM